MRRGKEYRHADLLARDRITGRTNPKCQICISRDHVMNRCNLGADDLSEYCDLWYNANEKDI